MNYDDALIWMGECDSTFEHKIKNAISESNPFPDFKNLFTQYGPIPRIFCHLH